MPRQVRAVPLAGDVLTTEQAEQLATVLARLLGSAVDALERDGLDPYTLLDEAGIARPPRGKGRAS